jgi:hypothetical protein
MLFRLFVWFGETPIAHAMNSSEWMFPIVEVIHMIGIVLLVGAAVILDLRLMGLRLKSVPVHWELASDLMPRAFAASGVLGPVQTANASQVAGLHRRGWKRRRIVHV